MSEEQLKRRRLVAYWLFSTVVIVFAAITAYIGIWARPAGATMWTIIKAGFPIWGITALAAIIILGVYCVSAKRQA